MNNTRLNINGNLVFSIDRVKMRRRMLSGKHTDYNP